jgi:hypothetical protein
MTRGQKPAAWQSRWRQGTCPVHGLGLRAADEGGDARRVCAVEGCAVAARSLAGHDRFHVYLAWISGPDEVREALRRSNDIDDAGAPTRWSREVRIGYPGPEEL